jgi:hypothetical protein
MKKIGLIALAAAVSLGGNMAFAALPDGVTPLTYIAGNRINNSKGLYLDTGWTLQPNNDVFEAVIEIVDAGTTCAFWCTRDSASQSSCTLFYYNTPYMRTDYNNVQSEISHNIPLLHGVPYTIVVSNGTTTVSNGARVDIPASAGFTETPGPLVLFASGQYVNGEFQNPLNIGGFRIYSFKIWRNGTLVRDFVPVRRTADNVVTLADAVEGGVLEPIAAGGAGNVKFGGGVARDMTVSPLAATVPPQLAREGAPGARPVLSVTDAATGVPLFEGVDYSVDFERFGTEDRARAIVTPLLGSAHARERALEVEYEVFPAPPPGYTRLEYVQGDGRSFWVTDYVPQPPNDQMYVDFAFTTTDTVGLFCSRQGSNQKMWSYCFVKDGGVVKRRFDYNNVMRTITSSRAFVLGERYRLHIANKRARTSNGDLITADVNNDTPAELSEAGDRLAIFTYYSNGAGNNPNSQSKQRLYRFRVFRSGRPIHDWVPVITPQGVVTLYDLVENEELTPSGTGSFIAGPAVNRGVEIAPIPVQTLPAGGVCEPAPVVTQAGTGVRLVAGTDYTVSYSNNNQVGLATLTVTGAGAFAGAFAATVPFSVSPPPPAGVTRLDYIQGNAAAYLVTDWTINPQTDRVETEIELTDVANAAIWCSRGTTVSDRTFTLFRLNSDAFRCDSGTGGGYPTIGWTGVFPRGVKLPILAHGADYTVGDVRSRRTVAASFTEAGGPLMLFASYYDGTANHVDFKGRHRMYEFRVFRQGVLVRRWVPVRTTGGVATVCDLMTGTTLTPSGGAFIAGPDFADFDISVADQAWDGELKHAPKPFVAATNRTTGVALEPGSDYMVMYTNNAAEGWARAVATGAQDSDYEGQQAEADFRVIKALPDGYERLEYLESDGLTALLTDYTPKPSTDTLTLDFAMRDIHGWGGLVCARGTSMANSWSLCWNGLWPNFRFDSHTNVVDVPVGSSIATGTRCKIKMSNKTASTDGGLSATAATAPTTAGGAMSLLCYYNTPTTRAPVNCAAARVYGCRVVRSGTLLHDWVPVRTPEGVVTLYDRVDGTTPECAGTGRLIAGPSWEHEGPVIPPTGTLMLFR